jgi:glycosyltransferase involved in cell wall biosynthesis
MIVGKGTRSRELRRLVASSGLERSVCFIEPVHQEELCSLLDQASCLVLPSRSEGLGRVILESMARARPVVGSSVGGIPELIKDGCTGRLVAPDDPAALAAALISVLGDPPSAEKMGHEARQSFERLDPAAEYEAGVRRFAEWVRSTARSRSGSSL